MSMRKGSLGDADKTKRKIFHTFVQLCLTFPFCTIKIDSVWCTLSEYGFPVPRCFILYLFPASAGVVRIAPHGVLVFDYLPMAV